MSTEKPTIAWVVDHYHLEPNRAHFIRCPIHEEDEPSCQLHDDWWYCFGCGASGDSIGLIAAVTRQPVADVLRTYTKKVPTWRNRHTVSLPPRGSTVRRAYRELNAWFFRELAARLEDAPDWLLLRATEYWDEQFETLREIIDVEKDLPKAEQMLRGLAALCERGLDVEQKTWWRYAMGQLLLREVKP